MRDQNKLGTGIKLGMALRTSQEHPKESACLNDFSSWVVVCCFVIHLFQCITHQLSGMKLGMLLRISQGHPKESAFLNDFSSWVVVCVLWFICFNALEPIIAQRVDIYPNFFFCNARIVLTKFWDCLNFPTVYSNHLNRSVRSNARPEQIGNWH